MRESVMERALRTEPPDMAVSVVSHGHDALLPALLQALARTGAGVISRVILTHNLPPLPAPRAPRTAGAWPFELVEVVNREPQGFGRNHNQAALRAGGAAFFAVLNPDVSWDGSGLWPVLRAAAAEPGVGCVFPRLLNVDGSPQDQVRGAVTPWALLRRRLLGLPDRHADWVSAAFWVLPMGVFRTLRGFDESFHMYCEDVDFCLRLQLQGWVLQGVDAPVVHEARRASHSDLRHFGWHLGSLLRLWSGGVLWRYIRRRKSAGFAVRCPAD